MRMAQSPIRQKVERAEGKSTVRFKKTWSFQYFLEEKDIKFL